MKNVKKIVMVLVMALVFVGVYVKQPTTSFASSDSTNVTKMLTQYKKQHYITADKYAKSLKYTKADASEKKMTTAMIKAYKKVLSNTPKKYLLDGAYFIDMDGDKKAEMVLPHGTCEADAVAYVYKYKSGKAVKVTKFDYSHIMLVNYAGHTVVIAEWAHLGNESISTLSLKNGKIKTVKYGDRKVKKDYLSLKPLSNHMKVDKNGNKTWIIE